MTDRKNRDQPKTKGPSKSAPTPSPGKKPTIDPREGSTDEGSEQATGRGDRGFDPNVNQRPPR